MWVYSIGSYTISNGATTVKLLNYSESSNLTLDLENSTNFYFNDVIFKKKKCVSNISFFNNLKWVFKILLTNFLTILKN